MVWGVYFISVAGAGVPHTEATALSAAAPVLIPVKALKSQKKKFWTLCSNFTSIKQVFCRVHQICSLRAVGRKDIPLLLFLFSPINSVPFQDLVFKCYTKKIYYSVCVVCQKKRWKLFWSVFAVFPHMLMFVNRFKTLNSCKSRWKSSRVLKLATTVWRACTR